MIKEETALEILKKKFNDAQLQAALDEAFKLGFVQGHKTTTTGDWIDMMG